MCKLLSIHLLRPSFNLSDFWFFADFVHHFIICAVLIFQSFERKEFYLVVFHFSSIALSLYLHLSLSRSLFISLSLSIYHFFLSIYLSIYLSISLSLTLSLSLFIGVSIYLSIYISISAPSKSQTSFLFSYLLDTTMGLVVSGICLALHDDKKMEDVKNLIIAHNRWSCW